MAIALDASTPIRFSGTGATIVSAAFTAPTDATLVCCIQFDSTTANSSLQGISDSGGLSWTTPVARLGTETTTGGTSQISYAFTVSAVSRTVTVTRAGASATNRCSATVFVFSGADTAGTLIDSITANNEGGSGTNNLTTTSLTPGANGVLIVSGTEWNALGACTSSDLKGIDSVAGSDHAEYAGAMDVIAGWKTCTSGAGVSGNLDASGAGGAQWKWCQIILREAGGGGGGRTTKNTRAFPLGMAIGMNWVGPGDCS